MPDEESGPAGGLTPQQYIHLTKLRSHFHKDVRKQLYTDADDKLFFENIKVRCEGGAFCVIFRASALYSGALLSFILLCSVALGALLRPHKRLT